MLLVYTTQVSNAYRARWLAGSEVNSKFYSPPSSLWDKIARREFNFLPYFVSVKSILKQSFHSVEVVEIFFAASWFGRYPPLFASTSVNNCLKFLIGTLSSQDGKAEEDVD